MKRVAVLQKSVKLHYSTADSDVIWEVIGDVVTHRIADGRLFVTVDTEYFGLFDRSEWGALIVEPFNEDDDDDTPGDDDVDPDSGPDDPGGLSITPGDLDRLLENLIGSKQTFAVIGS